MSINFEELLVVLPIFNPMQCAWVIGRLINLEKATLRLSDHSIVYSLEELEESGDICRVNMHRDVKASPRIRRGHFESTNDRLAGSKYWYQLGYKKFGTCSGSVDHLKQFAIGAEIHKITEVPEITETRGGLSQSR